MIEYADSTLMRMTKKELIEYCKCLEHNNRALEATIQQQYVNCMSMLNKIEGERND